MPLSAATVTALADALGGDDQATEAVEGAISAIEGVVGPVGSAERTIALPGSYGHRLELPGKPVTAVASVAIDGSAISAADYRVLRSGTLTFLNRARYWGGPDSEVSVTFTSGFAAGEEPDWLLDLIGLVAARRYDGSYDIAQESFGTHSVTHLPSQRDGLTRQQRRMLRSRFGLNARSMET